MNFDPTQPFKVPLLPPEFNFRQEQIFSVLLKARTELGELNGYSFSIPNPLLLLSPAIIRESVASSNIENINTTVEQVLQMQLFPEVEQKPPDKEVLRYREAIYWGFEQLKSTPISTRLVLGIHNKLLPHSRKGYRTLQNAISNTTTGEIFYTPPLASEISNLMGNWEHFVHSENNIDPLIKCIVAHYQFEAIHPFGDGNGRTGRILMVLNLVEQKLLSLPILYISGYINKSRQDYYKLLRGISEKGDWSDFIMYMLEGFYHQAKDTKTHLIRVVELLQRTKQHVREQYKKIYSSDLIEATFSYPIITPVSLGKLLGVNYRTASKYLATLVKGRVLEDTYVGKYHFFINTSLLELLKK